MPDIIAFLSENKLASFLGAVCLCLLVYAGILWVEVKTVSAELETARADNVQLTEANRELAASIGKQNDAIKKLKTDSDNRAADAVKAVQAAQETAKVYQTRAKAIESTVIKGDECSQAKQVLNDYFKGLLP